MRTVKMGYMGLIYLFLYTPIITLIIFSFNQARYSTQWQGFTLNWYHTLFANSDLWSSAWHSIIIGILSSTMASFIGLFAAMSLYRYKFMGKQLSYIIVFILIVMPDLVFGIALLVLYSVFHFPLGFFSLLIAHITFCIPFAIVIIYSRMLTLERNLFEAAKDLGASDSVVLTKILLPILFSAIASAWLLGFTLSLDDVLISYFVSGPSFQILPLAIYSMVRHGVRPDVNALCALMFSATLILVIGAHTLYRKK
ncbi:MAG: ABC transporter permease subunit [Legionellales bacterium]|nr:ABC transporter permease subunit [Legionellales bacterium]